MSAWLTTAELLDRLPTIATREGLASLRRRGIGPTKKTGKGHLYAWPECGEWYIEDIRRQERDTAPPDETEARTRKLVAEAAMSEYELERLEGRMITVEDAQAEVRRSDERVRARLLAVPGKYAPQLVGLADVAGVVPVLESVVHEVMAEMAEAAQGEDEAEPPESD